jgi:integrase
MLVPMINRDLLRRLKLSDRHPYYVMERGRDALFGFGLRVHRQRVEFGVRYRRAWHRLGWTDLVTVEEARKAARDLLRELRGVRQDLATPAGDPPPAPAAQPPRPERPPAGKWDRGPKTRLRDFAAVYRSERVETRNKPRTISEYGRLWDKHLLPRIGDLEFQELTPARVLQLRREIANGTAGSKGGTVLANRCLQQLRALCDFAARLRIMSEWREHNPASESVVDRFVESSETYCLTAADYSALGAAYHGAIAEQALPFVSLVGCALLLLTGARPGEFLARQESPGSGARLAWCHLHAKWPHIRLPEAKGDRPGKKVKGRVIWLPRPAVELILAVPRPEGCPWVLPGSDPAKPMTTIDKTWRRLCELAGVSPRATPKSARHGFRSLAPAAGVPKEYIQAILGHEDDSPMTDEVYLHIEAEAEAGAAGNLGDHVAGLLGLANGLPRPSRES